MPDPTTRLCLKSYNHYTGGGGLRKFDKQRRNYEKSSTDKPIRMKNIEFRWEKLYEEVLADR